MNSSPMLLIKFECLTVMAGPGTLMLDVAKTFKNINAQSRDFEYIGKTWNYKL